MNALKPAGGHCEAKAGRSCARPGALMGDLRTPLLEVTQFPEGAVQAGGSHDDMVEHLDLKQLTASDQIPGDSDDPEYKNLTNYAWYWFNAGGTTHPVGQKLANPWGLHDMHGNVPEWCQDWYGEYSGGVALDPQGPETGWYCVPRGGIWEYNNGDVSDYRSAYRGYDDYPNSCCFIFGFRVVLAPGQ